MGVRVGIDCRLYRNTGTFGTPVWNEITITKDASLGLTKGKPVTTSRASRYITHWFALKASPITFNILADTTVEDYNVLRDAWVNDTILDIAMANGPIATSGTQYWRADYGIYDFKDGQPLEEAETIDIDADLVYSANPQGYTTVP